MPARQSPADALARYVDRSAGPDACWPFVGTRVRGYGQLCAGRRKMYAHRAALELRLGRRLATGRMACHTCDNPPCCNPAHLYEGTAQSNHDDMVSRGRRSAVTQRGAERPDVSRRWIATIREKGGEAASVLSDEFASWMAQRRADDSAYLDRFVSRVERGECLDLDTHWLEPVMSFVPGDRVERDWAA